MNRPFTIIIPARYESNQLIGKPLLMMGNKPLIQVVWDQARKSNAERIIVATDNERVLQTCAEFGAEVVMTFKDHNCGFEILAEVIELLEIQPDELIVYMQADTPYNPSILIDQVVANLIANSDASVATLAEPIEDVKTLFNHKVVKVTTDIHGFAITFSRSVLPWALEQFDIIRDSIPEGVSFFRHVNLYACRAEFIREFQKWGPCEQEKIEKLEQLRAIWNCIKIKVALTCKPTNALFDSAHNIN
ncbi:MULTISPECIES: 3-deoxy-manno-octulosonate cytidylyltransferase [unclassified Pseudomonas]|uniref:3-deoxy-manno-octulosonate cytidylyltransferase n=1 Tax=unclassified Pseudomonas TaxID=196821 RepID=UPI000A1F2905|nr:MULTISPECIES: 3-deoxy-manno-octulosonate cytidylyltransferase [unclassified Pseudomonas]